jgi:hypothetical protein
MLLETSTPKPKLREPFVRATEQYEIQHSKNESKLPSLQELEEITIEREMARRQISPMLVDLHRKLNKAKERDPKRLEEASALFLKHKKEKDDLARNWRLEDITLAFTVVQFGESKGGLEDALIAAEAYDKSNKNIASVFKDSDSITVQFLHPIPANTYHTLVLAVGVDEWKEEVHEDSKTVVRLKFPNNNLRNVRVICFQRTE